MSGVVHTTSAHWARWRKAWSISTSASIASAIGVARMPTQGSWRPCVSTITGCRHEVHRAARQADARGRLDRQIDDQVLAGRNAAEHAAGMVAEKALRRHLVAMLAALLRDAGKTGADLDPLDRVDAHHRVGDLGVETVIDRLAPARRHAGGRDADLRARPNRPTCATDPCSVRVPERSPHSARRRGCHRSRPALTKGISIGPELAHPAADRDAVALASHLRAIAPAATRTAVSRADERPPPRWSRKPYFCVYT
jgi:hypothetical protein